MHSTSATVLIPCHAGLVEVGSPQQPGVSWLFSNMKLLALIGGAIAAAGAAAMVGLAVLDCCLERKAGKVAAS